MYYSATVVIITIIVFQLSIVTTTQSSGSGQNRSQSTLTIQSEQTNWHRVRIKMQLKAYAVLLCIISISLTQTAVEGVSLFNFWSHILPQPKNTDNSSENSVISSAEGGETLNSDNNNVTIVASAVNVHAQEMENMSSEESKITRLLNPMSWFSKTRKENAFEINAELGTVRDAGD